MAIILVCFILIFVMFYNKTIDGKKFIVDNEKYFQHLREEDYDFFVQLKYGEEVDCDELFKKRVMNGVMFGFIFLVLFLTSINLVNIVLMIAVAFAVFKLPYMQLKSYYKAHLHEIDLLLPYYLKGLEILIQHYTVPVAIGKSIDDAPPIFRAGLRKMVERINAGDASIDPYMEFANTYPVRDSMRMMRLLYRLGLGEQEKKQERLLMFSRTVSSLQTKAREQKYKERLHKMESQTMVMLVATGAGVMLIILFAMIFTFQTL